MECQQGFERCSNLDKDFRRKIAISAGVRYSEARAMKQNQFVMQPCMVKKKQQAFLASQKKGTRGVKIAQ